MAHMETPEERTARRKRLNFLCSTEDSEALACRLFVTIDTDTCQAGKREFVDAFSAYGRVFDLTIHKGFLFVQYGLVEDAQAAVRAMNNNYFMGRYKMGVNLANDRRKPGATLPPPDSKSVPNPTSQERCKFYDFGDCKRGDNCFFEHVNPNRGRESRRSPQRSPPRAYSHPAPRDVGRSGPPTQDRRLSYDMNPMHSRRERSPEPASKRRREDMNDRRDLMPEPSRQDQFAAKSEPGLRPRDNPYQDTPPVRDEPPAVDLRPPYDCVIITGDSSTNSYCDHIERSVVAFGMLTNIQVVDGEHLLKRAVEEAARHTVPYTICITPNNVQHQSVTLNILHGVPQEHRNMPLEDSLPFLSRNFDQYVETMKKKIAAANSWVPPAGPVCYLLNLLADGRRLSATELQDVLDYVQSTLTRVKTAEEPMVKTPTASSVPAVEQRPTVNPMQEGHPRTYPPMHSALPDSHGDGMNQRRNMGPGGPVGGLFDPQTNFPTGNRSNPMPGGGHSNPRPGGGHSNPMPGGGHSNLMPGGGHSNPMPGGGHSNPMPGGSHSNPMPGGGHNNPMPGGSHSNLMPGRSHRANGSSSGNINFDNPAVQRALDDLLVPQQHKASGGPPRVGGYF